MQTVMSLASSVLVQGGTQKLVYDSTQQSAFLEQLSTFAGDDDVPALVGHVVKDKHCDGFAWIYRSFGDEEKNVFALYAVKNNLLMSTPILYVTQNNELKISNKGEEPDSLVSKDYIDKLCPVGEFRYFYDTVNPDKKYWLRLNGTAFKINSYPALYKVLGTDILPNMASRGNFIAYVRASL
jgi:hypothetical protein